MLLLKSKAHFTLTRVRSLSLTVDGRMVALSFSTSTIWMCVWQRRDIFPRGSTHDKLLSTGYRTFGNTNFTSNYTACTRVGLFRHLESNRAYKLIIYNKNIKFQRYKNMRNLSFLFKN